MDIRDMVKGLDQAAYLRLRDAAETGKWPDGTVLDQAQRDNCLQLVMAYQALNFQEHQHLEVGPDGDMVMKTKRELKAQFSGAAEQEILRCKVD